MVAGGSEERHVHVPGADVDLYGVLGLKKECSDADLRLAYRRLAMTWHPDRCSASGSSARVKEAKERFQEIQGAYSVLSDSGKRLLYDVGVYDSDYDDNEEQHVSEMGDFLGEMAEMMSQATPTDTFEELQQLFVDMFQGDLAGAFGFGGPPPMVHRAQAQNPPSTSGFTFAQAPAPPSRSGVNKRCSSAMGSVRFIFQDHAGENEHEHRRQSEVAEAADEPRHVRRKMMTAIHRRARGRADEEQPPATPILS